MHFSLRFALRLHQQRQLQQRQRRAPVLVDGKTQIFPFKNGVSYLGFHTYITADGKPIRRLKNQNKRNAQRKFLRMAKLVAEGKLPMEKFQASYGAWKNHISHGNCYRLMQQTDMMVSKVLEDQIVSSNRRKEALLPRRCPYCGFYIDPGEICD